MELYEEAHLFVAAVRVLDHQKKSPPTPEEVSALLGMTAEWGHAVYRRLADRGIVRGVEAAFGLKVFVAEHTRIEDIPQEAKQDSLAQELEKFQKGREEMEKKVEAIQAELARKKKDLFADIEAKLKKEMQKKEP